MCRIGAEMQTRSYLQLKLRQYHKHYSNCAIEINLSIGTNGFIASAVSWCYSDSCLVGLMPNFGADLTVKWDVNAIKIIERVGARGFKGNWSVTARRVAVYKGDIHITSARCDDNLIPFANLAGMNESFQIHSQGFRIPHCPWRPDTI